MRGVGAGAHRCLRAAEQDEFQALTGKTEYADPTGMPWSGGTVCGFGNGQIILLTATDSTEVMDRFLASAEKDLVSPSDRRSTRLGDGAFSVLFDPDDPYQDHGAFGSVRRRPAHCGGHRLRRGWRTG